MNGADAAAGGAAAPTATAAAALFHHEDLACPICVETIEDAFATPCGHTFCFKCISTHLKNKSTCPSCGAHLVQDQIHPNFLLNKLIQRAARAQDGASLKTALLQHVQHDLAAAGPSIGLQELDAAIQLLQEKRQQVATHESSNKLQLLMLFLQHAKAKQLGQLSDLEQQLDVLQQDLTKARAAAATAAAAGGGGGGSTSSQPDGTAAAAAAAGGSRPLTPGSQQLQQQQTAVSGGGGAAAAPVPGGSLLGGRGSAFKRLQPAGGFAAQQQPEQQPQQQQQQQGFRSLTGQQPQQGCRPLPKPQQPQQQQQQATVPAGQQGFKPFSQQQQQQQQDSPKAGGQLVGASLAQNPSQPSEQRPAVQGFRPFAAQAAEQQQQQGFRPLQASHPAQQQQQQQQQQQGFRPLAPAQAAIDVPPPPPQQQQQGSRPLPATQGLDEASLNPEKKRKIMEQFDELQQAYLSSRLRRPSQTSSQPPLSPPQPPAVAGAGVGAFQAAVADVGAGQQQQQRAWKAGDALGESSRPLAQQAAFQQQQHGIAAADGSNAAAEAADGRPVGAALTPAGGDQGVLDAFSRMLYAVTHYSKLQPLAYVPPPSSSSSSGGGAQILSSVDFDCAGQLFAAAGVQQRILVHSYAAVLAHGGPQQQQHAPVAAAAGSSGGQEGPGSGCGSSAAAAAAEPLSPLLDLSAGSKLSCLSFSPAVQQYLLSSDYAGVARLWDLTGGRVVRQWEAHDKRIWAVDFCPLDATTFATGSDDGTVKVWGLCEAPVPRLTLPVRANVCSIKFSPANPHMLAAGNAGHQVQLFDLRAPRGPLAVLKGHSKAVSYVRWAGPDAIVSASTDSTLRLWTAAGGRGSSDSGGGQQQQQQQQGTAAAAAGGGGGGSGGGWDCEEGGWHCSQVFRGHSNSKHFVGLATQGPFIACGSETNEVFMYHQGLAQPSLRCLLSPWGGSNSHSSGGAGAGAGGEGTAGAGAAGAAAAAAAAAGVGGAKSPFASALCWKKGSDVLVAANSKGGVWVLSMQ